MRALLETLKEIDATVKSAGFPEEALRSAHARTRYDAKI
jgi:hypothetical protein